MENDGAIEAAYTEHSNVPALARADSQITLYGTDDPDEMLVRAGQRASAFMRLVEAKGLKKRIGNSDHIEVEAWTTLAAMNHCTPFIEWTKPIADGWEARCSIRTLDGRTIAAAEGMCSRAESKWRNREDFAIRGMAQTRAVSRACRSVFGFIAVLAGYSPTPAAEMTDDVALPVERASGGGVSPHAAPGASPREGSEGATTAPELDRKAYMRGLFALIAEFAAISADGEKLQNENERHRILNEMYGKPSLTELTDDEMRDFRRKVERQYYKAQGATS